MLDAFLQKEGMVQCCPWITVLFALLLGEVLHELKGALIICCKTHPLPLSEVDGRTEPISFIDDNTISTRLMNIL
eukprot:99159-Ditylum_brightwellii.AAC.1